MTDDYQPGEAYDHWVSGQLSHDAFWEVLERRAAVAQGKSWEQYCSEKQSLQPLAWPEPPDTPSQTSPPTTGALLFFELRRG